MLAFINRMAQSPLYAPIVSGVVSLLISVPSAYLSYHYATVTQDRQIKLEQVFKFDASASQIVEATSDFIAALNTHRDLANSKEKIRNSTTKEILDSEQLRPLFPVTALLNDYVQALREFNKISQTTATPSDIRLWTESFDKVIASRDKLSQNLKNAINIGVKS